MNYPKTYSLSTRAFLDTCNSNSNGNAYKNIITINTIPEGPLRIWVRRVNFLPLSEFATYDYEGGGACGLALFSPYKHRLMSVEEFPDLISFLLANGYTVDTSLTKMINSSDVKILNNKLLCFIVYTKN